MQRVCNWIIRNWHSQSTHSESIFRNCVITSFTILYSFQFNYLTKSFRCLKTFNWHSKVLSNTSILLYAITTPEHLQWLSNSAYRKRKKESSNAIIKSSKRDTLRSSPFHFPSGQSTVLCCSCFCFHSVGRLLVYTYSILSDSHSRH